MGTTAAPSTSEPLLDHSSCNNTWPGVVAWLPRRLAVVTLPDKQQL